MLRSILAVLAGLVVTLALVMIATLVAASALGIPVEGPPTGPYLALNLVGSAIAGIAGGAVAMRLAPHTPHGHVIALAVVILLLSLPTLLAAPGPGQPAWYGVVISILGPVSVLIGGLLGIRWRRSALGEENPVAS